MGASDQSEYAVVDQPADEPLVIVGPPDELEAEFLLRNPADTKRIVRGAHMRAERPKKARPGAPVLPDLALRRIVLRSGETRSVPFAIPMSPHTPPGEYRARLDVAGQTRDIIVHVTESIRLEIAPSEIVVESHARKTVTKRVMFTNAGNVPLVIGEIGPVVLDDPRFFRRTGRATILAAGDQIAGLDDFVTEFARQAKSTLEQMGHLDVRIEQGEIRLEPGDVRTADLQIRVPAGLDRHTRYDGSAALYDADLVFSIVPTPAPRTRRGAKTVS